MTKLKDKIQELQDILNRRNEKLLAQQEEIDALNDQLVSLELSNGNLLRELHEYDERYAKVADDAQAYIFAYELIKDTLIRFTIPFMTEQSTELEESKHDNHHKSIQIDALNDKVLQLQAKLLELERKVGVEQYKRQIAEVSYPAFGRTDYAQHREMF